ncbi:hypothetical protein BS78_03G264000, partial [Paspalum vaginatum]
SDAPLAHGSGRGSGRGGGEERGEIRFRAAGPKETPPPPQGRPWRAEMRVPVRLAGAVGAGAGNGGPTRGENRSICRFAGGDGDGSVPLFVRATAYGGSTPPARYGRFRRGA